MLGFSPAGAQVYDDIYYTPADAQKEAAQQASQDVQRNDAAAQQRGSYADDQNKDGGGYYRGDEYVDYDNDYYYATNINRFNRPFYNLSFYSGFYNPYWYDPFWVDPYWGWSPWVRPGISISFGAPYWTSFGGWYNWYGYPGFYSCWSYPYYAGGWGGWGGGGYGGWYGYNAGYYSGYWNGYYAGLYNNYYGSGYRTATYGPRYTLNTAQNSNIRSVVSNRNVRGFRSNAINVAENPRLLQSQQNIRSNGARSGVVENSRVQPGVRNSDIRSNENGNNGVRNSDVRNNDIRQNNAVQSPDRNIRNSEIRQQPGRFEVQPGREATPQAAPRNDRNFQTPRYQSQPAQPAAPVRQAPIRQEPVRQAPTRTYEAPTRNYTPAPTRTETPRMNTAPSSPSRSFGGGSSSPSRGGGGGFRR